VFAQEEQNTLSEPGFETPAVCGLAKNLGACGSSIDSADRTGFGVFILSKEAQVANAYGTWAVTAE
jgi:hypothetical protein